MSLSPWTHGIKDLLNYFMKVNITRYICYIFLVQVNLQCAVLFTIVTCLGDIGYLDEDNQLIVTDRLKELIKYKGFQVGYRLQ